MYYVYILTNKANTVLYTGITGNLEKRVAEQREKVSRNSFTARYNIYKLVYYEETKDVLCAIEREKQIKAGSRKKKIELISGKNPEWKDLLDE